MTGEIIQMRPHNNNGGPSSHAHSNQPSQNEIPTTYGALSPVNITALEALQDDIKRTQAHILWLEHYIATSLTSETIFNQYTIDQTNERESTQVRHTTASGNAIRAQMQINRKRQQNSRSLKLATHPAVHELQTERRHLHEITRTALILGIKLDNHEFTRMQADAIISTLKTFAQTQALDYNDPHVQQAMSDAISQTLREQNQ